MNSFLNVCYTSMKLKYITYNSSIDRLNFVQRDDKINVFINFESVLQNITSLDDISNRALLEPNFNLIMESEMLNLIAHYKHFFKSYGLDTKVYLYYTDLMSDQYTLMKYNEDYRSYYKMKFLQNPKYQFLGNRLISEIIPKVKSITDHIPDVYFISATNIEGSLVPNIIYGLDKTRKNFIISGDRYDTQYQLQNLLFCNHYIKRNRGGLSIMCEIENTLESIFKDKNLDIRDIELFKNSSLYSLLLAINGDRLRSIDPIKRMGPRTLLKYILQNINSGNINSNTSSLELLLKILPEDSHDDLITNFNTIHLNTQLSDLSEDNIFSIKKQIIDKSDLNTVMSLNDHLYRDYPLMLPQLIN